MARFRSRHTSEVFVPVVGRVVQPREVIDVPDQLVSTTGQGPGLFFPPRYWSPVIPARTARPPASAAEHNPDPLEG